MIRKILACCITFGLFGAAAAFAAEPVAKPKAETAAAAVAPAAKAKMETVEKSGVIEIQKADQAKKEKYDTVLLKVGEETFKLLPGRDKKIFKPLESLNGKNVKVTGELLTAKPPKYPLPAIKVESFEEKPAAKPAAAPAKK